MSTVRQALGPFLLLTFIYFVVGFLTTVNGQFQAPLQNAFLADSGALKNTLTTLISFFFFLGYLLNSRVGGRWVDRRGYKTTLLRGLLIMVGGLLLYAASTYGADGSQTGGGMRLWGVPLGYFVFLCGSFLMGTSAAIIQVVVNPYIAAYDLPGTTAIQRMNINTAINSIGTTVAPFFVSGVLFAGVALSDVSAGQLMLPILIVALCIVFTTAVTSRLSLPDLADTRASQGASEGSLWQFRHFVLGVVGIFFYVGTEVSVGVNCSLHAKALLDNGGEMSFLGLHQIKVGDVNLGIPALLATLYWGGMMIGRLVMSFFGGVAPRTILVVTTVVATALLAVGIVLDNLWIIVSVGLVHSVMWGAIFTLAVDGLGAYTSRASGVFMMGVFGGAVFPMVQALLADELGSWQFTWALCIVCELVMLAYALWGSRKR